MVKFCQRLGGFDAESVEVEVLRVLSPLKQPLGFHARFGPDRYEREPDHIRLSRSLRCEEIRNGQAPPVALPRKGKPQEFVWDSVELCGARLLRWLVHNHVVPIRLSRKVPIHNFGFEQSRTRDL